MAKPAANTTHRQRVVSILPRDDNTGKKISPLI